MPVRHRQVPLRRSGCQTCKSRHKRCDEHKPRCSNCVRLNLKCRPPELFRAADPCRGIQPRRVASTCPKSSERKGLEPNETTDPARNGLTYSEPVDIDTTWIRGDSPESRSQSDNDEDVEIIVPAIAFSTSPSDNFPTPMPVAALSPPSSELEQWLLHHYVHRVSKVLVNVDGPLNPLREILIPRAANSPTLMNAIYANSALHISVYSQSPCMQRSSLSYYSRAASDLSELVANAGSETKAGDLEILLLTIVFLCKYEIISVGSHWRPHLQALQKMLNVYDSQVPKIAADTLSYIRSFIAYHSSIAALTVTDKISAPCTSFIDAELGNTAEYSVRIDPYMGVSGELIQLLHIAAETAMLDWSRDNNSFLAICTVIKLHERIRSFATSSTTSESSDYYPPDTIERLDAIAHAYKNALVIYSHIILDGIAEMSPRHTSLLDYSNIRDLITVTKSEAVSACMQEMLRIPDNDHCTLGIVPLLFIVASETKDAAEFDTALMRLSKILQDACLGNVGTTVELLQKIQRISSLNWRQVLKCSEWDLVVT